MKQVLLLSCSLLLCATAIAQPTHEEIIREVNEHVWYPFMEHWAARNAEAFNALHTQDVLRVGATNIRIGEAYFSANDQSFGRENMPPRHIEFSFEQRVYGENVGYEVGYYHITVSPPDREEPWESYGYFHVVLRKVDGVWKIAQDFDTDMVGNQKIGAEQFIAAEALLSRE